MKYSDLAGLSDEGLVHKELALERELVVGSFRHRTGQLEDSSTLGKIRRDIARIRTAQRERERAAGLATDTLRNRYRGTFNPEAASVGSEGAEQGSSGGFLKGLASKLGLGGGDSEESSAG